LSSVNADSGSASGPAAGDRVAATRLAHDLKSEAATLGALTLSADAAELEAACARRAPTQEVDALLDVVLYSGAGLTRRAPRQPLTFGAGKSRSAEGVIVPAERGRSESSIEVSLGVERAPSPVFTLRSSSLDNSECLRCF